MDSSPAWHEDWTRHSCASRTRECYRGDAPCVEAAERDGFVFISSATMCRKEDVITRPGTTTYLAIGVGALGVLVAGVLAWRFRRRKRSRAASP